MRGLRDYFNQVSYELMNVIITLIPLAYLAHVLGNIGLGVAALAIGTAELLILLLMSPTAFYGQWHLSNHRNEISADAPIFWNTMLIHLLMSLVAGAGLTAIIWFGQSNQTFELYHYPLALSALLILGSLLDISWYFIGTGHHLKAILQSSSTKIVFLMLILVVVKQSGDADAYILLVGVMRIFGNSILWFQLPKHIFTRVQLHPWQYLSGIFLIATSVFGVELYTLVGRLIVPFFHNDVESWLGYYSAALSLNQVAIVLVATIGMSTMPRFYRIYRQNDYAKLIEHIDNAVESVTAFAVPLMFGTAATAVTFTTWFLGPDFREVGLMMAMLSPLILLLGWNTILGGQFLRLAQRSQVMTLTLIMGFIINLGLDFLLIPRYGLFGAIYAVIIAELSIFGVQLFFARDVIAFGRIVVLTSKYIVNGLFMYLVIVVSSTNMTAIPSTTVFQLFIGIVVYVIGILLLRSNLVDKTWQIAYEYWAFIKQKSHKN